MIFIKYFKPAGINSRKVLNRLNILKKYNKKVKIGYCGTLDKWASGYLYIAVGKNSTKQLAKVNEVSYKKYYCNIYFTNKRTKSDDIFGEYYMNENNYLCSPIKYFVRQFDRYKNLYFAQMSPIMCSKKQDGVRLYNLKSIRKTKNVYIKSCKIIRINQFGAQITMTVRSGFYVRAFARILGGLAYNITRINYL